MAKHRANGEGMIRKRSDGRWEARYTDTRETDPKKRVKYITNKSQKVVVEKLKQALAEVSSGVRLLSNDNPTVEEWLAVWLREYKLTELRDSTYDNYFRNINTHLTPMIGHIKMKDLTGLHIQQMYNRMMESKEIGGQGVSSATVAKVKNILSGALKQAVINKIIRSNPIDETNPPKVEDPDIRIMSKEEQQNFLSVLPFYNTGNMFAVSLATGMRIGEICALDVKDINREQKYIDITKSAGRRKDKYTGEVSVKVGPPKTKHSKRRIPLLPSVEIILDRQAQLALDLRNKAGEKWKENTLVFPTDEGNIHDLSGLRSSIGRILKRADLPHMTIHALRHSYVKPTLSYTKNYVIQ
jgi:integrase